MKIKTLVLNTVLICRTTAVFLAILLFLTDCSRSNKHYIFPEKEYQQLFIDVQTNKVFSDDKTFPDCIPKSSPAILNFKYGYWKSTHKESELFDFVKANFELPSLYIDSIPFRNNIVEHIQDVLSALIIKTEKQSGNSSLIPLPYDFVIPGGRFRETYYWDTYFTLLGYVALNRKDIVYRTTENFAYLINTFGFIPNGNRSYYLSRSQPPFFSLIVELNANIFADSMYIHFLPELEKEYQFWTKNPNAEKLYKHSVILQNTIKLNRYFDELNTPRIEMYNADLVTYKNYKSEIADTAVFFRNIRSTAESGWDFSSRWFGTSKEISGTETLDILPVDLNCLLYHLEKTIGKAYSLQNNLKANIYNELASKRKANINHYFWSDTAGFYFDYNFKESKITGKYTLAGIFPLFMGIADSAKTLRASSVIRKKFLQTGGVVTTLVHSGQQWDYPNGWAPLQWITIKALNKYRVDGLADTIKKRWLNTNEMYFDRNHKMLEKYNVVDTSMLPRDGEYPTQDGFGWTNGVYLDLLKEVK